MDTGSVEGIRCMACNGAPLGTRPVPGIVAGKRSGWARRRGFGIERAGVVGERR